MKWVAKRTIWRYVKNTLAWPDSNAVVETIEKGQRCDWAGENLAYRSLGWIRRKK